MTDGPEGARQVPAMLNGEMTMVDFDRIGVALIPEGILPKITELPDAYDLRYRGTRSMYDFGASEHAIPSLATLAFRAVRELGL